jgi:hypothetical protein
MTLTSLARPSYMPKYKPDASCVLYLEGQQDPQSATIRDLSGYGNHGTITGATWVRNAQGIWVNSLNGTTGAISLATSDALNFTSSAFTIMMWVKIISFPGNTDNELLSRGAWNSAGYIFLYKDAGSLNFFTAQGGAAQQSYSADGQLSVGGTYLLSVVRNGASVRLYKNATDITSTAGNHVDPLTFASANGCRIGNHYNSDVAPCNAQIISGRAFNINFSVTQITGIYNQERYSLGV